MIDEGLRYPIHNYYGYTEDMRGSDLESEVARWNNKSSHIPKENSEALKESYRKECQHD